MISTRASWAPLTFYTHIYTAPSYKGKGIGFAPDIQLHAIHPMLQGFTSPSSTCSLLKIWNFPLEFIMGGTLGRFYHFSLQKKNASVQAAIIKGNLQELRDTLSKKQAKTKDRNGRIPLHQAVLFERRFIIKYILKEYPKCAHQQDSVSYLITVPPVKPHIWKSPLMTYAEYAHIKSGSDINCFPSMQVSSQPITKIFWHCRRILLTQEAILEPFSFSVFNLQITCKDVPSEQQVGVRPWPSHHN